MYSFYKIEHEYMSSDKDPVINGHFNILNPHRSYSLSTKVNWSFYNMIKIRLMLINNVDIFTLHESLL